MERNKINLLGCRESRFAFAFVFAQIVQTINLRETCNFSSVVKRYKAREESSCSTDITEYRFLIPELLQARRHVCGFLNWFRAVDTYRITVLISLLHQPSTDLIERLTRQTARGRYIIRLFICIAANRFATSLVADSSACPQPREK